MGGLCLIPGLGRVPGEGKGYPLQYSGLENSMYCIVHGVTKSRKQLNDFCFHRTVDAFAFNCYSISRKEQDVWSFMYSSPHSFLSEDNEIIESLTKRLNRTELETVFWTCHLSLLFTIGFLTSLEEFSFLPVFWSWQMKIRYREPTNQIFLHCTQMPNLSSKVQKKFTSLMNCYLLFLVESTIFLFIAS